MSKKPPEMVEGREAFRRFRDMTKAILAVPHAEMKKRLDAHREQAAKARAEINGKVVVASAGRMMMRR